jgi:hypothetical protein
MADYCTLAEIKADAPDSAVFSTTDHDAPIESFITRASRLIDKEFGGWDNFFQSTDSQTRYYDGSGEKEQEIDYCLTLTQLSVSENGGRASTNYTDWTENTDFYVWPYNYSSNGKPIQKLIVDNDAGSKGYFAPVKKGIKVEGVFGYSSTPPSEVAQACRIQVVRWLMRAKADWQDATVNAQTGEMIYAKELDPDIKKLLAPLKLEFIV